jgi:hypothetical protein
MRRPWFCGGAEDVCRGRDVRRAAIAATQSIQQRLLEGSPDVTYRSKIVPAAGDVGPKTRQSTLERSGFSGRS